jgi:hypothetical protein
MHKYAAATALAITLTITMLTLAVSASLTPANAAGGYCDNEVCFCQRNCTANWYARWLRCREQSQQRPRPGAAP